MASSNNNPQSRKWLITINNPERYALLHDAIKLILACLTIDYWCMVDEIGESGTYHTHIYIYSPSPIRFSTLKKHFPIAHIDKCHGTVTEGVSYIKKNDKWAGTLKADTTVEGTFEEYGTIPQPGEETSPRMATLLQDIYAGKSTAEIINDTPSFALRAKGIDELRETFRSEKYANELRTVDVTYIYGDTGSGKTHYIYETYPLKEICRITNYAKDQTKFDAYNGHDVLVFEGFEGQIPINEMLSILDIYPLSLPARYRDRVACYTKVYILSTLPIDDLYKDIQYDSSRTWEAFMRRFNTILHFDTTGKINVLKEKKDGNTKTKS
ncbi:hypothetical protein M2454_002645 [Aequitasia blattaphilus]|uniref:Viral replication protein n=1 Tax=Aequitasia blattaphilus TaxID=2949332 RepID=A0ABT1EE83_9FIRM|nr:viral replication protein [Aequitasia blattaphilus]MCP1103247.1 viral replication protein [Aequitasia blattaphilus]MCR8615887.1 viral replication protein [Aequitasia blattaphilus]